MRRVDVDENYSLVKEVVAVVVRLNDFEYQIVADVAENLFVMLIVEGKMVVDREISPKRVMRVCVHLCMREQRKGRNGVKLNINKI